MNSVQEYMTRTHRFVGVRKSSPSLGDIEGVSSETMITSFSASDVSIWYISVPVETFFTQ